MMAGPLVKAVFKDTWQKFASLGIDTAKLDARVLLGAVLGGGAERVLSQSDRPLTTDEAACFERYVARRERLEPISQILGVQEFWSLPFVVTSATLTPRPDTETLVQAALDGVDGEPKTFLDLGTGTGCVALSLLSEWKSSTAIAVDNCTKALSVARENAKLLSLADRCICVEGDWTQTNWTTALATPVEVVVSNPPYIPKADIEGLDLSVRGFEPHQALCGGVDGLDAYRAIINGLPDILCSGGMVVFEVGIYQAKAVAEALDAAGFTDIESLPDLAGITRVVRGRRRV